MRQPLLAGVVVLLLLAVVPVVRVGGHGAQSGGGVVPDGGAGVGRAVRRRGVRRGISLSGRSG
ncbi:hypothetical protein [Streptomyces sp. NPDC007856]|uniref:hypothetical protein n=1 Tax=Streptomyces sp. NPDC007856 TaxID=3364781 RepID=UPI0036B7AD3A